MSRPLEWHERVAQWEQAFHAVRTGLTNEAMRAALTEMEATEGIAQLQSYMSLARNVMANDRTAAVVAAMLVATGVKPIMAEVDEVG